VTEGEREFVGETVLVTLVVPLGEALRETVTVPLPVTVQLMVAEPLPVGAPLGEFVGEMLSEGEVETVAEVEGEPEDE
jgi:hypothetical protein